MESKNNKYKLPAGLVGSLSIFFFFLFKNSSNTRNAFVIVLLVVSILILLLGILSFVKKRPQTKVILLSGTCLFLFSLVMFLDNYFERNNMEVKNITTMLVPIALYVFLYGGVKLLISKSKDEKEIKRHKKNLIIITIFCAIFEIAMIYVSIHTT